MAIKAKKIEDIKILLAYVPGQNVEFYREIVNWPTCIEQNGDFEFDNYYWVRLLMKLIFYIKLL